MDTTLAAAVKVHPFLDQKVKTVFGMEENILMKVEPLLEKKPLGVFLPRKLEKI